jgi:hypothetical protein
MKSSLEKTDQRNIERARALARLLDAAVGIPGTSVRFGLDAVLGILPGAGDILGAGLGGYLVMKAARWGAPPAVIWRMVGNVAVDTILGTIPLLGDVFDIAYKSNLKNVRLLERYAADPATVTTRSRGLGFVVAVLALLALLGLATLSFLVARFFWRLISG